MRSNVHTHCTLCDGNNTPREMIEAAIKLGFSDLGFSSHSPTWFEPTCPGVKSEKEYIKEIRGLQKEYSGKIHIACGIEQDTHVPVIEKDYDYIIGSNHCLPNIGEKYIAVDSTPLILQNAVRDIYDGNAHEMVKDYYKLLLMGVQRDKPSIVGHFDLVKKFNQKCDIFDEDGKEYKDFALQIFDAVIDAVKGYDGIIEVNTGAISRGWRTDPYPSLFLLEHAAQRKAPMIITGDSHSSDSLDCYYDESEELLRKAGFNSMIVLYKGKFCEVPL